MTFITITYEYYLFETDRRPLSMSHICPGATSCSVGQRRHSPHWTGSCGTTPRKPFDFCPGGTPRTRWSYLVPALDKVLSVVVMEVKLCFSSRKSTSFPMTQWSLGNENTYYKTTIVLEKNRCYRQVDNVILKLWRTVKHKTNIALGQRH